MRISVQSIQFHADDRLLTLVENKASKLSQFFDRIIDVQIYLKIDGRSSQIKDKEVEVKLNLPGSQLFAKAEGKLFEEALDEAIDSATRQLKKHKERLRNA
jgi:putative sigma-54 modulation protein